MIKTNIKYFLILFLLSTFLIKINITAQENSFIEIIYNNESYLQNEEIVIDFNLNNIKDLYEVDLRIEINEDYFIPKEELFTFKANSIYKEVPLINDYIDNVLRLKLIKNENIQEGYTSNIKNNLTSLKLKSVKKITNIKDILKSIISIKLYDTEGKLISYELDFNEELKYEWNKDYQLNVYSTKQNIEKDISILNRQQNEYELSIEENINYNLIGDYFINVIIYDYLTNEIIKLKKEVKIIDCISPTISTTVLDINLKDTEFKNYNLRNYFNIEDNYDHNLDIVFKYYSLDEVELSKDDFYHYLESNLYGFIKVYTVDKSNNVSETLKIPFNIIDTTAPTLEIKDNLEINVENIKNFKISDYLKVYDQYDKNPLKVINYYDLSGNEIIDINSFLNKYSDFVVKIIVIDESKNMSNEFVTTVKVIDNISPLVEVNDINLEDKQINSFNYRDFIKISDNIDDMLSISFYIYNNEELIKIINSNHNDELMSLFKKYLSLSFYVMVKDTSGNITTTDKYKMNIIDTTCPVISYHKFDSISNINDLNLSIYDNYSSNINIEYYLNDNLVSLNDLSILKDGMYELKIVATDSVMNKSEIVHKFTINSNIQNIDSKINFNIENSIELILIISLFSISLIVLVVRIKRVKKYDLIKNEG